MNVHPIFVHFPIALLSLYSLIELIAYFSPRIRRWASYFAVMSVLLYAGVISALVALATGGIAEDLVRHTNPRAYIIHMHDPFATGTTIIYLVLAAAYLIRLFDRTGWGARVASWSRLSARIWPIKLRTAHLILDTWVLPVLALAGFIGITITGALGAAIVYGPSIDPIVNFCYHLFYAQ